MSQPGRAPRYAAFLSYSRGADAGLASAIQQALHRFAKPWYRVRAVRVFRDDSSLSANPGLWTSITNALDSSEYFVLLASPRAAGSVWVDREVAYWLDHHPPQALLIAVTDGEIRWDPRRGDLDPELTTCLPPSLYGRLSEEPRWVDFRGVRSERALSLRNASFRDKIADLAAPLHHADKDDLSGEDVRQHRRTMRLARSGVAALVVTTVLSIVAALFAVGQARIANEQRDEVSRQLRTTVQRQLIATSTNTLRTNPELGLKMALAANTLKPGTEFEAALAHAVGATRFAGSIRHAKEAVADVAFSPTADIAATADTTLRLSAVVAGEPVRELSQVPLDKNADGDLAFSPDGRTLAMAGFDGSIRFWDVGVPAMPRALAVVAADRIDASAAYSPDGRFLVSVGAEAMKVWDVHDPAAPELVLTQQVTGFKTMRSVRFFAGGTSFAVATLSGSVLQWTLDGTGRLTPGATFSVSDISIDAMAISADGSLLAAATGNGLVTTWDLHDRAHPALLSDALGTDRFGLTSMAFAPDRPLLAVGGGNRTAILWDLTNPKRPQRYGDPLTGQSETVWALAFSHTGSMLATASAEPAVHLWDLTDRLTPTRTTLYTPTGYTSINDVKASPDGRYVAAAGSEDFKTGVRLWERSIIGFVPPARLLNLGPVRTMAFQPGTSMLATGYENGNVTLWDIRKPIKVLHNLYTTFTPVEPRLDVLGSRPDPAFVEPPPVTSLAFSADGKVLAVGNKNGSVVLWDLSGDRPQRRASFTESLYSVFSMEFAPTGRILATTRGASVQLRDVTDPAAPRRLGPLLAAHRSQVWTLAFSPDGHTLASGSDDSNVVLWDVTDPSAGRQIGQPFTDQSVTTVKSLAFTPDGRTLVAGITSGPLLLWDLTDRTRPALITPSIMFMEYADALFVVAPSYHEIITVYGRGDVHVWDLAKADHLRTEVVKQVCTITGGGLTEKEWARYVPDLAYQQSCAP